MAERIYMVSGLTALVKGAIDESPSLRGIWVRGELTNFTHHGSGHMYFTLKDAGSRLRAVMFRGQNRALRFRPADGLEVMAHGDITVYERNGDYQLYVDALEPAGLGSLFLAFQQLHAKLAQEGLFAPARKRPLPPYPRRVALVTSPTGAAVHDLIRILRQRQPGLDILVVPVLVQGPEAAASIAAGLAQASALAGLDLVIAGRGGGSPEELWPFNEEIVARAIVACSYPVISAVGHEVDVTIADFAADARAATPTAAAEMAVPDSRILARAVQQSHQRLVGAMRRRLAQSRLRVDRLCASGVLQKPDRMLLAAKQRVDEGWQGLCRGQSVLLARAKERMAAAAATLHALSPLATIGRGYAVCTLPDGSIVRSIKPIEAGQDVGIILQDGNLACRVQGKEEGAWRARKKASKRP